MCFLTPEAKYPTNKEVRINMLKGATLISTGRPEVVHEAEVLQVHSARPDSCYLSQMLRKGAEENKALASDKFTKRHLHLEEDGRTDTGSTGARQFRAALHEGR